MSLTADLDDIALYADVGEPVGVAGVRRVQNAVGRLQDEIADQFRMMERLVDAEFNKPEWTFAMEEIGLYVCGRREDPDG